MCSACSFRSEHPAVGICHSRWEQAGDNKKRFNYVCTDSICSLPFARKYPELYDNRRRTLGRKLLEIKGIAREDREKREWWQLQGVMGFGAPCIIFLCIDHSLYLQDGKINVWPVFDCAAIMENIMLLAIKYGLGTIPQLQTVTYPEVLRKALGIPDSKLIVLGIAIANRKRAIG